jgi:hypothetical protein
MSQTGRDAENELGVTTRLRDPGIFLAFKPNRFHWQARWSGGLVGRRRFPVDAVEFAQPTTKKHKTQHQGYFIRLRFARHRGVKHGRLNSNVASDRLESEANLPVTVGQPHR